MGNVANAGLRLLALLGPVAVTTVLAAAVALGSGIPEDWRYYKPVELPPDFPETGLVEAALDPEIYANAASNLADIRVVEQLEGREVPFKLLVEQGEHRRSAVPARMHDLGSVPNEYTSFILSLNQNGMLHNELEIQTSSSNFQRRVQVSASDDGENWRELPGGSVIFDLTIPERGFSTSDTRVIYPVSTARFLRVAIMDEGLDPLEITGAVVFSTQQLQAHRERSPLAITGRENDAQAKTTKLSLDAGATGFPANSITLDIPQRNFHRQVALDGSDDGTLWTSVQPNETLYDFDTPRFVGSDTTIRLRESRYRYYRVTIFNEDNPILPVDGAQASGFVRKIIFEADSDNTYGLYYGNDNALAPSYELERIFPYLVTDNLPLARLGPHTSNPQFVAPEVVTPPVPFSERYPWLLPAVVALAALAIGVFLASLVRQVRDRLQPPQDAS